VVSLTLLSQNSAVPLTLLKENSAVLLTPLCQDLTLFDDNAKSDLALSLTSLSQPNWNLNETEQCR
jgi:hypothetical protein